MTSTATEINTLPTTTVSTEASLHSSLSPTPEVKKTNTPPIVCDPVSAYQQWRIPECQIEMQTLFDTHCQKLTEAYQAHLDISTKAKQQYDDLYNPSKLTKKQRCSKPFMKNWRMKMPPYEKPQSVFEPPTDVMWYKYNPEPKSVPCKDWLLDMRVPFTLCVDLSFPRRRYSSWESPRSKDHSTTLNLYGAEQTAIPNLTTLIIRIRDNDYKDTVCKLHNTFPKHPHLTKLVISGANGPSLANWRTSGIHLNEYLSENAYIDASRSNDLKWLVKLKKHGLATPFKSICAIAAECGHTDILDWVEVQRHKDVQDTSHDIFRIPFNDICTIAATYGMLSPIDWVDAQKQLSTGPSSALIKAIENGHWELLRTLVERPKSHLAFVCDKQVFGAIVLTGNIEMLEWYVKGNHPTSVVNTNAVDKGELQLLDWLHNNKCLSNKILLKAMHSKRWDIFKWGITKGYRMQKWERYVYRYDESSSEEESPRHSNSRRALQKDAQKKALTCTTLAKHAQWDLLQFAHGELHCEMDAHTFTEIAKRGEFEYIQWAHNQECPWDTKTCAAIASRNDLKMLQWAHENGCPWDASTCAEIALHDNLPMLQWARNQGCPWDGRVCANAARNQRDTILKWAIQHHCDTQEFHEQFGSCSGCGKGGYGDVPCRCNNTYNSYFDEDNWQQREADDSDEARRCND